MTQPLLSKHLAVAGKALMDAAIEAQRLEEIVVAVERRQHAVEEQWLQTQGELRESARRQEQAQKDSHSRVEGALADVATKLGILVQLLEPKAKPEPSVIVSPEATSP